MKIGDLIVCGWTGDFGIIIDIRMYHSRYNYRIIWLDQEANIDPDEYVDEDDVRLYEGG